MRGLVSIILGVFVILFGGLGSVWHGFQYFSLCSVCLLAFAWVIFLILDYIDEYVKQFDEKFNLYFVKLINQENLDKEIAQKNLIMYQKKFKKTLRKEKFIEWGKIFLLYAIIGACLIAMIKFI